MWLNTEETLQAAVTFTVYNKSKDKLETIYKLFFFHVN